MRVMNSYGGCFQGFWRMRCQGRGRKKAARDVSRGFQIVKCWGFQIVSSHKIRKELINPQRGAQFSPSIFLSLGVGG